MDNIHWIYLGEFAFFGMLPSIISVKVKVIARQSHFEPSWIVIFLRLAKRTMHVTPFQIEIKMNVINSSRRIWKFYARKKILHSVMQ